MQRLDEATRSKRELENNRAVEHLCEQNDVPMHSGPRFRQ